MHQSCFCIPVPTDGTLHNAKVRGMFRCPHCEKKSIQPLRKLIMSPGLLAICHACNGSSGIRYASWLTAMVPGTILMIAAYFVASESAEWSLNIGGLALMIIIPFFLTPLHKEE